MKKLLTIIAFAIIGLSASATKPSGLTNLFVNDFQMLNTTAVKISADTLNHGAMAIFVVEYGIKTVVMSNISKMFAKYSDISIVKGWHFDVDKYVIFVNLNNTEIYSIFYLEISGDNLFLTINTKQMD